MTYLMFLRVGARVLKKPHQASSCIQFDAQHRTIEIEIKITLFGGQIEPPRGNPGLQTGVSNRWPFKPKPESISPHSMMEKNRTLKDEKKKHSQLNLKCGGAWIPRALSLYHRRVLLRREDSRAHPELHGYSVAGYYTPARRRHLGEYGWLGIPPRARGHLDLSAYGTAGYSARPPRLGGAVIRRACGHSYFNGYLIQHRWVFHSLHRLWHRSGFAPAPYGVIFIQRAQMKEQADGHSGPSGCGTTGHSTQRPAPSPSFDVPGWNHEPAVIQTQQMRRH
ncbi:hypothetical protein DFH09DRAFT_1291069 [Mycena vulgaris]|nr:hypothetical protein DFH09DRAFT_1291069 [Mycena vulgaris]